MQKKRITVNLVSESDFTIQGHGVHTAYLEMRHMLESQPSIDLLVNSQPLAETDITHIHTFGSFAFRRLISRKGGKKVVSAHVVPDSLVGSIAGATWWVHIFKYYLKFFYNLADTIIAVSPATKESLIKLGVKRPIVVISNTIDTAKYKIATDKKAEIRQSLDLPLDKFIVVGNGQIQPRKRFDTFLKMAKKLPNTQFIWVGGIPFKLAGSDYVSLSRQIKKAPKNLLVSGVVSLSKARLFMQASDLMFMPSMQETFGLAIIEGAASGLPVLVRNIHDYDATFSDYVAKGEEDNFKELIEKFQKDTAFYKEYQTKAKALAKRYDVSQSVKALMDLYDRLLEIAPKQPKDR